MGIKYDARSSSEGANQQIIKFGSRVLSWSLVGKSKMQFPLLGGLGFLLNEFGQKLPFRLSGLCQRLQFFVSVFLHHGSLAWDAIDRRMSRLSGSQEHETL